MNSAAWAALLAASRQGSGAPSDPAGVFLMLAGMIVFLMLLAVAAIAALKKRPRYDAAPALPPLDMLRDELALPAPEPPEDRGARHRHETALAGRARFEACRIAADLGLRGRGEGRPAGPVRVLAGPGPTGALALAVARHLEAFGVEVSAQLVLPAAKLGAEARRERLTLERARVKILDGLAQRELGPLARLVMGVEDAYLPRMRREDVSALALEARKLHVAVDRLEAFDAVFVPPPPDLDDLVIPVPETPLTREETRLLDSTAQEHYGIPGEALMEHAGYWAARETFLAARDLAARAGEEPRVTVLCGRGNNGGDGMVIARHLFWWGVVPRVILLGARERCSEDCRNNLDLLAEEGVKTAPLLDASQWPAFAEDLNGSHLIVDALLGTGMSGAVRGETVEAIARIDAAREHGAWVLAVDGPSGLDVNTGEPLGACVRADLTVTFAAPKVGFLKGQGPELCGQVILADIGLPRDLYLRKSP
ncbi:MAG: NAD(P)H-hydrate epimerase [Planctomycetota bacterium]|nr:NAD(P)H-hydrate epimerase [Planctomycetota bacterium]